MKYFIWLCSFQLAFTPSYSQAQEDALRNLLENSRAKSNIMRVQEYSSQLAWLFFTNNQYDSAIKYYKISLRAIPSDKELRLQGSIMTSLGIMYGARGKFDSCINYYRSALKTLVAAHDTTNALIAESNLSIVFKNIGLYEESLEAALHVVSLLKPSDNSIIRGSCYNTIGSVYIRTRDYNKALEYYRLALKNRKLNDQKADVAKILNNLGELYILMRQYDSAEANLKRAAEMKRYVKDLNGLARTINNIGKVAMLKGAVDKAERRFNEAISIHKTLDDPVGMIEVLNNLGEVNIITMRLDQAKKALREAEELIRRAGTPDYLFQNLELQIRLDRERQDYASGMMHLEQLSAVKDTILNQEKNRTMQAMQIRYETLRKEQQIAMLEQQEEINRNRIRSNQILIATLSVGLILIAAVALLAYSNFRNARSARQRFELLLADTRHRIKNNLQTLASIFNLQTRYFTDNNMILEARSSESRVHAMSLLHQKFYSVSPGHRVDLRPYITDLVEKVVDIYGFGTGNLSLTVDVDAIQLDIDDALPLSLIVQEIVSNAFKYAFEGVTNPKLGVEIKLQPDGELKTIISDNGGGLDPDKTRSSHGFNLVDAFVAQLNGSLQVKTEKGTTFSISFPVTPPWKKHSF